MNATGWPDPPAGYDPGPVPGEQELPLPPVGAEVPGGGTFGVPSSVAGKAPVEVVGPPAGFTAEDIARAWVQHVRGVVGAFRGVLAVLPHGDVIKVLAEAGQLVETLSRGL